MRKAQKQESCHGEKEETSELVNKMKSWDEAPLPTQV